VKVQDLEKIYVHRIMKPDAEAPLHVHIALTLLREALVHLKCGGSKRTAERVRLAISSAKGALRNADNRKWRKMERA
jgi:hypothetical protein